MKISRADFLKRCSLALMATAIAPSRLASSQIPPGRQLRIEEATAATFRPYMGESFLVNGSTPMTLARVTERPVTRNVEQFSLIFHAPPGQPIPEGMNQFHHRAMGTFSLFIVPIGMPDRRRTVYQACFSRHLHSGGRSNV